MGGFRRFLHGCKQCGLINYIKYNYFSRNIVRDKDHYFYPIKGTIIQIAPSAKMYINGDFFINAGKIKGSKAESYLILDDNSKLIIDKNSRINYGSTIHLNKSAELSIGSVTTNVGINIQVKDKIDIGEDCMFGRNTTIFDSTFHPTGASTDSMKTNTSAVFIGNHVWIGAYSFVAEGTHIGDGSMIGSYAYVSGNIVNATTIVRTPDIPAMIGYMWARSEKDLESAQNYYSLNDYKVEINETAVQKYGDPIQKLLSEKFSTVVFEDSTKLISNHIFDSLALISIVKLLENKFTVKIPYYEISSVNFDSVELMASLIYRIKNGEKDINYDKREIEYPEHNDNYSISEQNTLIEYVKEHAKNNPNKIAVMSEDRFYTYEKLFLMARKYGTFLQGLGLIRGDRVVVKSIQTIEYIIIYLGIHYAGGVITTIEKSTPNNKILEIAKTVNAKVVICDSNNYLEDYIFVNSQNVNYDVANTEIKEIPFPDSNDSADILFTTGTTGESKGVELSHTAIIAGAENIAFGCEMKRDTVLVVPNPLSHSNAIKNLGACLISGCTFYVLDGMTDLKAFFDALDCKYGKVATVLPPAAIRTLFQVAKEKLSEYKDKLDYLMAAMAPLLEPDRVALRELLPNTRLYNHYGCSESSSICIYDFNKYSELKNCVGKAMPHSKVFFVDDQKNEIVSSSSNLGLLAVRGDATMKGYFMAPELTATIKDGNIIYTKDVGYMDEEGFVYILGRNDDVINIGGLKVSPLEVEAAASSYDGVADCICIGVDDEISGQALKLLVVPSKTFDMEKLRKSLSAKLQGYKNPTKIEIVDKVERTYNGKINRKYYRK